MKTAAYRNPSLEGKGGLYAGRDFIAIEEKRDLHLDYP